LWGAVLALLTRGGPNWDAKRPGCGSGSWKQKRLNFCGSRSTLKKAAGSGSKPGSI